MLSPRLRNGLTITELLIVIVVVLILLALLLPAVQSAREAARRVDCNNRLRQLSLAMYEYHDTYKVFPRNFYYIGPRGWCATSANTRLLPYIEQTELFHQFQSHANDWTWVYSTGLNTRLPHFICPSAKPAHPRIETTHYWNGPGSNYAWCLGSSLQSMSFSPQYTAFNGFMAYHQDRLMTDILDGLSHTIMGAEILSGSGNVNATAVYPYDILYVGDQAFSNVADKEFVSSSELESIGRLAKSNPIGYRSNSGSLWAWYGTSQTTFNTVAPPNWIYPSTAGDCCPGAATDWRFSIVPPRSRHPGGVNIVMADCSTHFLVDGVDHLVFQRMGNRYDGTASNELDP